MLSKLILIALLLLVLTQSQISKFEDPYWPAKCSRVHNIYAVDRSGSMSLYGSWARAMSFLAN